jgi:hypothetical protein
VGRLVQAEGYDGELSPAQWMALRFFARANAIQPDTEPGLEKWLELNAKYAKIWPQITVKRNPPADWKEWQGKPDKLQYFSPNPGQGD